MSLAAEPVTLLDMFNAIEEPMVELPDELVPFLENVFQYTDLPVGERLYTARSPGYDQPGQASPVDMVFIKTNRVGNASLKAAVLDVRIGFDASGLTLIGESIPKGAFVFPALRIVYVSRPINVDEVQQLNTVLRGYGATETMFPIPNIATEHAWPEKFTAVLSWWVNGGELPALAISLVPKDPKPPKPPEPDKDIRVPGLPVSFGPVEIAAVRRVRDKQGLRIFLVGEFRVSGFTFQLDGLGIVIPLKGGFIPQPQLMGAGLDITRVSPPMQIMAALRWAGARDDMLAGGLVGLVKVTTPAVEVLGAGGFFRATEKFNSVFLYVEALLAGGRSLFGPPPFTVTGLSAGFGINSTIKPPAASQLPVFPLVSRLDKAPATPEDPTPEPPTPMKMLDDLAGKTGWIRPEDGSYWAAIGVQFTSFRFIETKALALVEFGNRLNLMLLGRTSITFPKNADVGGRVHARLNIDLRLAYLSDQHLISLDVAVAPGSFFFDPACELTGGIALCVWTGGDRGGDFVISIGGYHPQFARPDYYPTPTRLGFRWNPCSRVVIQAQGYTALTPGAIMFGGALAARYEKGLLSAWFTAHLDALIQWKPFYLDIAMGISIGVAFTIKVIVKIRVSIEVGIDLQLWTPPLGGHVSVKVWFISFGFDFGSARKGAPPVPWSEFRMQLPSPIRAKPEKGLLLDVDESESEARSAAKEPLLVSSDGFAFSTEAAVPASVIRLNGEVFATADEKVNIRPMGKAGLTSEHIVTIDLDDLEFTPDPEIWKLKVIHRDLPQAMWGKPVTKPSPTEPGLEPGLFTGLHVEVPGPDLSPGLGPVTSAALDIEPQDDGYTPLRDAAAKGPAPLPDPNSVRKIVDTLATSTTAIRRSAVYDALTRLGAAPEKDTDGELTEYARLVGRIMVDPPLTTTAAQSGDTLSVPIAAR
ncbi:DUF6603 domain-containing protein [Embleya scabrispora]|uniref:DUF6603 domain-containing protein n=1 Tax=Embleya scabrispora TaxID=159449 RepID=UPI0003A1F0A1|nr:DUF6603 domain-containing protein [Embleya scabrispora]MYS78885.1 hypothetical protein [Streptomyces sp. SID5474]